MREIVYLTQDEIDALVQQPEAWKKSDYGNLRALQDGLIDKVTYPDKIVFKRDESKDWNGANCR